jgi:thiamine-phosphate pyrophosphorylase
MDRKQRLQGAHLYLICDDRPDQFLERALDGGVDIVQLRCKQRPDDEILAAARRFARVCAEYRALFVLNDRPDLAVAAQADGVHVGQDDMPVAQARAIVGARRLVGLSTHTREQVDGAAATAADYIGVGPVHETPTKPGRGAVGVELVRHAAAHTRLPFFAIGGIGPGNVDEVCAAGGTRIAVVRALVDAANPERTAAQLRAAVLEGSARERNEAAVVRP